MTNPPDHLNSGACAEWSRVVALLIANETYRETQRAAIAVYCTAWDRMVRAEAHVSEHGEIVSAPRTGVPIENPYLAVAKKSAMTVVSVGKEIGLTGISRASVPVERVGATPVDKAGMGVRWHGLTGAPFDAWKISQ